MKELTDNERQLVASFLSQNYELFQEFLDENDIEPAEAELIIDKLLSRS